MRSIRYPVSKPLMGDVERELVERCFDNNWLTHGEMVERFEHEFAREVGSKFAIAVSSGTTALHLILAALDIGRGDEVIVPDMSFVATANAVAYTGAKPVLVDVSEITWGLSAQTVEPFITVKTKAIIGVHLYGQACDIGGLNDLCGKHRVSFIEDAAEGLGATYNSRSLGTHGLAGAFSFYANKIITTGEGGMVVTDDPGFANRLRLFRGQGQGHQRYVHIVTGFNYRMTAIQAAIGIGQLSELPTLLYQRNRVMDTYRSVLGHLKCVHSMAAPWLFTVLLPPEISRDAVMNALLDNGIETRPTFVPMHRLPMYINHANFPASDKIGDHGLSLPTYPQLTIKEASIIAQEVKSLL